MINYIKKQVNNILNGFSTFNTFDKELDELITSTDKLLEKYSGFYQRISYHTFDRLPLDVWYPLNDKVKVKLLRRDEKEINFLAKFADASHLNYHNHPDATELFILLVGEGRMIIKDKYGKNVLETIDMKELGQKVEIPLGLHHKFIVTDTAITYGVLRKYEKNEENNK